jgi:hypothetical protein
MRAAFKFFKATVSFNGTTLRQRPRNDFLLWKRSTLVLLHERIQRRKVVSNAESPYGVEVDDRNGFPLHLFFGLIKRRLSNFVNQNWRLASNVVTWNNCLREVFVCRFETYTCAQVHLLTKQRSNNNATTVNAWRYRRNLLLSVYQIEEMLLSFHSFKSGFDFGRLFSWICGVNAISFEEQTSRIERLIIDTPSLILRMRCIHKPSKAYETWLKR